MAAPLGVAWPFSVAALLLTPVAAAYARVISWWTAGGALLGSVLYLQFAISPLPVNLARPVTEAPAATVEPVAA